MAKKYRHPESGIALTLVLIAVIVISILASYALVIGFNHRTVMNTHVKNRTQAYYSAQAGVVDANWRIRNSPATNTLANNAGTTVITGVLAYAGTGVSNLTNPGFNPNPYCLHMDTANAATLDDIHANTQVVGGVTRCNPDTDILIDISEQSQVTNVRTIVSRGHTPEIDGV